ncbi:hypothetical protein AVEN_203366-1, partial [Araneus ventricosus]
VGSRWPDDKVSGPTGFRLETRIPRRAAVKADLGRAKSVWVKRPTAGVVPVQVSSSSSDCFKITNFPLSKGLF